MENSPRTVLGIEEYAESVTFICGGFFGGCCSFCHGVRVTDAGKKYTPTFETLFQ